MLIALKFLVMCWQAMIKDLSLSISHVIIRGLIMFSAGGQLVFLGGQNFLN